jgi:hypothetical protein
MNVTVREIPIRTDVAEMLDIRHRDGWTNPFTRRQAPQALYKNGSRVRKVREDEGGDVTPLGVEGEVLGSIWFPSAGAAYFVEWDNKPRVAMFIVESKIKDVP